MINIDIEKVFDLKNLNISHFKDDVFKLFDTYKFIRFAFNTFHKNLFEIGWRK